MWNCGVSRETALWTARTHQLVEAELRQVSDAARGTRHKTGGLCVCLQNGSQAVGHPIIDETPPVALCLPSCT